MKIEKKKKRQKTNMNGEKRIQFWLGFQKVDFVNLFENCLRHIYAKKKKKKGRQCGRDFDNSM